MCVLKVGGLNSDSGRVVGMANGISLSKASEYEQLFQTRHRRAGRPSRENGDDVLFPSGDVDPVLTRVAQRRAFAVVHEEQRARLTTVFHNELKVLKRRGVEQVAADAGIQLSEGE